MQRLPQLSRRVPGCAGSQRDHLSHSRAVEKSHRQTNGQQPGQRGIGGLERRKPLAEPREHLPGRTVTQFPGDSLQSKSGQVER